MSNQKALTKDLYNYIQQHMTTELGAGQISSLIKKMRMSEWSEQCSVYLQAVVHEANENVSRGLEYI